MKTQNARKVSCAGLMLILALVQSACATPAQAVPTQTIIVNTPTVMATSTPANTATPEATATLTETPAPTATSTPNVTPTQLPELPAAVEGKGNVVGLVLWNDQPVPKAAVWLCERFEGACLGQFQYRANTDQNGYYVFKNVTPGEYLVAVNSFSTGWFIFYFDANGNKEQTVSAGENLVLQPLSIWKFNLRATIPTNGNTLSQEKPTFKWEAYPDAAYYQITIYDDLNFKPVLVDQRVDGIEFTPVDALVSCRFSWDVQAYNNQGVLIAVTVPGSMMFHNIDVPGNCRT